MKKQSGGEFASTDAAEGAQDAALQELWLSAEIPVEPCSRLQHLQRPTPSHLGSDTPNAARRGYENMGRGRRSVMRIPVANGSTTIAPPQRDNTLAGVASGHQQPVPIFQQLARGHPSSRRERGRRTASGPPNGPNRPSPWPMLRNATVSEEDNHARFCSPAFRNRFHWWNG
jgi:hypothetical protein